MSSTDTARAARIAFVGCGSIAGPYARTLATHPELTLVGAHDLDPVAQADFTAAHGCAGYADLDDLTADAPDVVVNLTSAQHHHSSTRELIERGQNVFSEKPLALRHDEATELVRLAAERNVRLACAPSLWLGAATQATAELVAGDLVGPVRLITAEVNQGRVESWHPAPAAFYRVGPVVDAGVYPISFLTAVFGPVREVVATSTTVLGDRRTLDGAPFPVVAPDAVIAVVRFASGPVLRLSCNFYVDPATVPRTVELHGDRGSIRLADWVQPGSAIDHAEVGGPYREHTPADPAAAIDWSVGLLDLVQAIGEDRPHRAGAEHAAHVVEVLNAVETSAAGGAPVAVRSSFAPPPTPSRPTSRTSA